MRSQIHLALVAAVLLSCTAVPPPPDDEPLHAIDDVEAYLVASAACFPPDWWLFPPYLSTDRVLDAQARDALGDGGWNHFVQSPTVRACVLAARGDCTTVMACLGFGPPQRVSEEACTAAGFRCEDDVQVGCYRREPALLWRRDCLTLGLRCIGNRCQAPCMRDEGYECRDARTGMGCHGGGGELVHCAAGTTCTEAMASPLDPLCTASGGTCTEPRCDGEVLELCGPAGRFSLRRDCASGGMTCRLISPEDPYPQCVAAADECEPGRATCDGDALTYCAPSGRVRRFDCVAHGYLGCETLPGELASCVPAVRWY